MLSQDGDSPHGEPERDLSAVFDLDRSKLTKTMVDRIERCLHEIENARADLKEVLDDCREQEFSRRDIQAMKKIAKLRLDDKRLDAQEQLAALQRVGRAVGFDLFDWAETEH